MIYRALKWSVAETVARQGLQFLVTIILARLLTPEDFGIVAVLFLFTALATVFVDGGMGSALIQKQITTRDEESTAFFFNLFASAVMAIALVAAGPWFADFFSQPVLQPATYALALNIIVGATCLVHRALLTRALEFKTLAKVGAVSSLLSGVLAIVLAQLGLGVWSLVWQVLTANILSALLLWFSHPWRPKLSFKLDALKRLFGFGGFLLLSGVLDAFFMQLHGLIIGKLFSARDLGFYQRAMNTRQTPLQLMETIFNRVLFPAFARDAADKEYLSSGVRSTLALMMFLNIPVMLGLAVFAEAVIVLLFGQAWQPSAPILQILCVAGIFWPFHTVNLNALMAQGHSDLYWRLEIIKKTIGITGLVVAAPFGVLAIAGVQVLTSVISIFINGYYTGKFLNYGPGRQLLDMMPLFLVGAMTAGVAWLAAAAIDLPSMAELPMLIGLCGAFYLFVSVRVVRPKVLENVLANASEIMGRRP